jgi:hypothetical protein
MLIQTLPKFEGTRDFEWSAVNVDHIREFSEVMTVRKYDKFL